VGLADAELGTPQSGGLVADRVPLRGRITSVIEARRLLERAAALIEVSTIPAATR